jgi:hypothetical protein
VTTRRAATPGVQPELPDELNRSAERYGFKKSSLADVLAAFGLLSAEGQRELVDCLVQVRSRYQLTEAKMLAPSKVQARLRKIADTTQRLLNYIGINKKGAEFMRRWESRAGSARSRELTIATRSDTMARAAIMELVAAGGVQFGDLNAANADLNEAYTRFNNFVFELLLVQLRAEDALKDTTNRVAPGRGGQRRGRTARGRLIEDSIFIYAKMRERYPGSGRRPGFGGPMLRFIYAVAALVGARVSDNAIREVWQSTGKSKRK